MTRKRFPRIARVRTRTDFGRVFETRHAVRNHALTAFFRANDLGHPRLGLGVGRRCGNAVRRNRIKRILREVFRTEIEQVPRGLDIVLVPRNSAGLTAFDRARTDFLHLMAKLASRVSEA